MIKVVCSESENGVCYFLENCTFQIAKGHTIKKDQMDPLVDGF